MDNLNKRTNGHENKSHVGEAASHLLHESKKYANELYEEGIHKLSDAQHNMMNYSDEILQNVRKNPITSILIAAGCGFILSSILRKK